MNLTVRGRHLQLSTAIEMYARRRLRFAIGAPEATGGACRESRANSITEEERMSADDIAVVTLIVLSLGWIAGAAIRSNRRSP